MLANVVGRTGYFGCLVLLGVVMLSVSCLAVFGATGAITAQPGAPVAAAPKVAKPAAAEKTEAEHPPDPTAKPESTAAAKSASAPTSFATKPAAAPTAGAPIAATPEAAKPTAVPQGTVPPKVPAAGPEGNIAQRLDREAVGGNLKLRALGAAKTTQGERAVLAIYVRMENVGRDPAKIDPAFFKLVDRAGTKYSISKVIEASLPAIELGPAGQPGASGQNTEGNLTFEIPRAAAGLALTYEPPDGAQMRIPLPPEFG
jgi:long-chain acyl-CoA synthetase